LGFRGGHSPNKDGKNLEKSPGLFALRPHRYEGVLGEENGVDFPNPGKKGVLGRRGRGLVEKGSCLWF